MRKEKDLTLNSNKKYNTTQLHTAQTLERHIFHRDIFAHYLRWTHVLRIANKAGAGQAIVDFGCGTAELLELLYRNKYGPKSYVGMDIREKTIQACREHWAKLKCAKFVAMDLVNQSKAATDYFKSLKGDIVASFEVMEHVNKKNGDKFLANFALCGKPGATFLLSTPNFDPSVGAAQNHIYDGKVQEWSHAELKKIIPRHFKIVAKYGTFASQRDYQDLMDEHQKSVFERLHQYYDANLISVIFAPMFPEQSRNTIWVLKKL